MWAGASCTMGLMSSLEGERRKARESARIPEDGADSRCWAELGQGRTGEIRNEATTGNGNEREQGVKADGNVLSLESGNTKR